MNGTDPSGLWTWVDRRTQIIEAFGTTVARQTDLAYDAVGNLTLMTTGQSTNPTYAHPVTTKYVYDADNRPTQTIEGFGNFDLQRTTTTGYDPVGNVISIISPRHYDSEVGPFPAADPATVTTKFEYDKSA